MWECIRSLTRSHFFMVFNTKRMQILATNHVDVKIKLNWMWFNSRGICKICNKMLCSMRFRSFPLCWFCLFRDIVPGFSDNDLRRGFFGFLLCLLVLWHSSSRPLGPFSFGVKIPKSCKSNVCYTLSWSSHVWMHWHACTGIICIGPLVAVRRLCHRIIAIDLTKYTFAQNTHSSLFI